MICIFFLLLFFSSKAFSENEMRLILVHSVWRHGDRTPKSSFRLDPLKHLFSSHGELTNLGKEQHIRLGKLIRKRYIEEDYHFLPNLYDSKQIYIRSTNRKRTIESAEANILGMYGNGLQNENVLIKIIKDYDNDCIANIQCKCPRRSYFQSIAHSLPEYRAFIEKPEFQELLRNVSVWTGEKVVPRNFWMIVDNLKCQKIHFKPQLKLFNDWYSEKLFKKMNKYNNQLNYFQSGLYKSTSIINGTDIRMEIKKLRIGPLVNDIFERINQKIKCVQNSHCDDLFIRDLLYFAYSSHDMTVYSLLSAFGIQDFAGKENGEWPDYTASIFIELFLDIYHNLPYFKLIYRPNSYSTFTDLTKYIKLCRNQDYCSFKVLKKIADLYKIDENINTRCQEVPIS